MAKHAGGRPTKLNKEIKRQIEILAKKGFTDVEMSEVVGVTEQTLNNWKKKSPEFFESLKDWKLEADQKVEVSLYQRACGYYHSEDKIFNDSGRAMVVQTIKHYPPDPTSMIFWLKNRQPDKWRDRQEIGLEFATVRRIRKSFDGEYDESGEG